MKKINRKSVTNFLSYTEMKNVAGGRGEGTGPCETMCCYLNHFPMGTGYEYTWICFSSPCTSNAQCGIIDEAICKTCG